MSDDFVDEIVSPENSVKVIGVDIDEGVRLPRHLLIVVHGMRSDASFSHPYISIRGVIRTDTLIEPVSYRRLSTWEFLTGRHDEFNRDYVYERINVIRENNLDRPVSILCHSNGTKILSEIGKKLNFKIEYVFLCGSVCPQTHAGRFDFVRRRTVNECGARDIFPILAASFNPDKFGHTGTVGFHNSPIIDRFFLHRHSGAILRDHVEHWIIPIITEGKIRRTSLRGRRIYFHAPYYIRRFAVAAAVAIVAGLICLGAP